MSAYYVFSVEHTMWACPAAYGMWVCLPLRCFSAWIPRHGFGTAFGGHLSGWVRCVSALFSCSCLALCICSAPSGQVLPSSLAPNGPPGHAALWPGRQSLGRAELAPTHMKTRAKAELSRRGGAGCMWGCRRGGGPPALAHRCTASSDSRSLPCQLVFNTRLSHEVIAS